MKVLFKNKLWNWGHLEGSHNEITKLNCKMTPEEFGDEYGINNSFIVSYGGNITPPFDNLAKRLKPLNEIKWSILGDASSPIPESELGFTNEILDVIKIAPNITGCVMDDFFSPERMKKFTPEVLKKIKCKLNENGLDFWCVLYQNQLDELLLKEYLECFDGVSFWLWGADKIIDQKKYFNKFISVSKGLKTMLGIYLWDYAEHRCCEMDKKLFKKQISFYFKLLLKNKIDGVVFCSSTIGDAKLETNDILKKFVQKYGNKEIKGKI